MNSLAQTGMKMIEKKLYNLIFPAGLLGYRAYSLFDEKARLAFNLRTNLFSSLEKGLRNLGEGARILVHISSVGEYLQARPIVRLIRRKFPTIKICLSFFSPSADRLLNKGVEADIATYLPFDKKKDMSRFLDIVAPELVIFSCYDLWPNLIWLCKERGIKLALINASLADNSGKLRKGVRWWFRRLYQELDLILSATEQDRQALISLGIAQDKIITTGNARFDETVARIKAIPEDDPDLKLIQSYLNDHCVVFGSTWQEDDDVIIPALDRLWQEGRNLKVIIAPHEVGARKIEHLREKFLRIGIKPVLLWEIESRRQGIPADSKVIIISTVGKLYKLYRLALIAFVGGSFRKEVHNVMEPAGFGIPVLFGPMIRNSIEAQEMVRRNAGFIVKNSEELYERLKLFLDDDAQRMEAGRRAYQLVLDNQGAGENTVEKLTKHFPEIFRVEVSGS